MKAWMLALSLVAVLSFTGFADAAKGAKKDKGIKGTIVSVTGTSFTMTVHAGKKKDNAANAATTITVDTKGATVTGTLAAGAKVTVVGNQSGGTITASTVTVGKAHEKKKKNA